MIRSMTAFARCEQSNNWGTVIWELRSVNHRYLEPFIRMPETFRALEPQVRERLTAQLNRGKVECNLKFQASGEALAGVSLNRALAERVLAVSTELARLMGADGSLRVGELLRWPGMVSEPEPDLGPLQAAVLATLEQAVAELVSTREREGERIAVMLEQRCQAMLEQVAAVKLRRPEVIANIREKLNTRLAELPLDADPGRLEQEMMIVAQRMDVAEELDRLEAHLAEIAAVLKRTEPVGRRLDFLMQELNREANTLGSKSADTETTRSAVELKVLIEQMREQVQNLE